MGLKGSDWELSLAESRKTDVGNQKPIRKEKRIVLHENLYFKHSDKDGTELA